MATRSYTYGYGRAEDLAGIIVVVLIAASAAYAGYEAINRFMNPGGVRHLGVLAIAGVVGFLGNELVAKYGSAPQIMHNVDKLGAPFHSVFTAERAQAYKPRLQAFEYMLDQLGCGPQDILHVSSSLRYDLIPAHDLRVKSKVYVNRCYEPSTPYYGYHEIPDLAGLPALLGL